MSWLSSLTTIEPHASICNGHLSYINNPPLAKSFAPVCTSKGLSNSANLSTGGEENLVLSSPKTWRQASSYFWDSYFWHKSDKVRQPSNFMLPCTMAIHFASTCVNDKVTRPVCTSKGLSNCANLTTGGEKNLVLSSSKTWWQGSSHSWDSPFFYKTYKVGQGSTIFELNALICNGHPSFINICQW